MAWFVSGLVLGLCLSVVFIVYDRGLIAFPTGSDSVAAVQEERTAALEQPTFEFYTMLPEMEVAVSEEVLAPVTESTEATTPSGQLDGAYVFQVGSFRKLGDADRLKASLALLGLEAQIQTVSINGEETWHRVRVGPYTDRTGLGEARSRLKDNQFTPMLLKIKG